MKVGELIRRLSVFHDNTDVNIISDLPIGYPLKIEAIFEGKINPSVVYIDIEAEVDE